jgi:transposase
MGKTFRDYEPDQLLLMPPSLRDWLPEDHLAYFISDLVERLDLSEILDSYSEERGYPPYHPVMMTKLLLYGYAVGVRSSRKLQQGTREHVAFRVLCAGNEPDFRTIAAFRTRHLEALEGLFSQVLDVCAQAGLVKLGVVAIDGTKIKANASKHKAMSYGRMKKERRRLRAQIRKYLRECQQVDAEEDALYGADKLGDELPEELADAARRLQKIDEAMAALREEAASEAKAKGRPPKAPKDKAQRNFTDPDSRIMKAPDKSFVQAYNGQVAVDAESQVIVAKALLQQANDKNQLVPMVHETVDNVGLTPETVVADSGYWVGEQVERIEYYDIEPVVAPRKIRHREWRESAVLEGPMPEGLNTREKMEWKLKTEDGRRKMKQRWSSVEPVCGQIKHAMGFRQFSLRGHRKTNGEWTLVCTAHNILKLFRASVKLAELLPAGPPASPLPATCA